MKDNKQTPPKKMLNKQAKKNAVKDLEIKLTDRFIDVVKALGHNSDKITKDIKKASKQFSKKLHDKFSDLQNTVENKAAKSKLKADKAAFKAEEKAKKIVQKATKNYPKVDKVVASVQKHVISEFYQPSIPDDKDSQQVVVEEVRGKEKLPAKPRLSSVEATPRLGETYHSDSIKESGVTNTRVVRKRKSSSEKSAENDEKTNSGESSSSDEVNATTE